MVADDKRANASGRKKRPLALKPPFIAWTATNFGFRASLPHAPKSTNHNFGILRLVMVRRTIR